MLDTVDAVLDRLQRSVEGVEALQVPPNATSLDFPQAEYRSATQPMQRRLRAAIEAAQYEPVQ